MGIMTQTISRDKVAWAFDSTSGDLSLFIYRKEIILNDDGGGRFQYISNAIASEYFVPPFNHLNLLHIIKSRQFQIFRYKCKHDIRWGWG